MCHHSGHFWGQWTMWTPVLRDRLQDYSASQTLSLWWLPSMPASPDRFPTAHLPYSHLLSLQVRILWDTVSKASLKSMLAKITALSLATLPIIFLKKATAMGLVKQELPLINLCHLFPVIFLSFTSLEMDFNRMCSTIFPGSDGGGLAYRSLGPPPAIFGNRHWVSLFPFQGLLLFATPFHRW